MICNQKSFDGGVKFFAATILKSVGREKLNNEKAWKKEIKLNSSISQKFYKALHSYL